MLLPEPATSLGLHSGSALILPCSCPATTLAMLPPLQRASPHPPQPGMSLLSPQASPQGRDARQSLTRGISALDGVVWLWVVLSTTGTPGSLAAFITGADTFPSVSSWWEISPPCERMAVGPARGSAGCHAPSPHLCHGGCFTSHTSMAAAPTRTGQELAFPQGNLCLCMCSGWVLVLSRDSEPSLGQPCLHPHPNPSLSLSPSLSQCLGLCLHFWSHLGGGPASGSVPHCQVQQAMSCTLRCMETAVSFGSLCLRESLHRYMSPSLRSQPAPGAAPSLG